MAKDFYNKDICVGDLVAYNYGNGSVAAGVVKLVTGSAVHIKMLDGLGNETDWISIVRNTDGILVIKNYIHKET